MHLEEPNTLEVEARIKAQYPSATLLAISATGLLAPRAKGVRSRGKKTYLGGHGTKPASPIEKLPP